MLDVTSFLTSQTTSKYVLDATLLILLILSQYVFDATQATSLLAFVCICHTGTTDAAWPQLETYIPNNLSSQSRDLLLYCKSWQWRYINLHANLRKKEQQHRSFEEHLTEKKLALAMNQNHPMKMSCHCGETRKHPDFGNHVLMVWK